MNRILISVLLFASGMNRSDALEAFHHDAAYLFAGAAFVTVGLLAAGFAAIQRKRDPLLLYFALFAALYGLRLWVQSDLFKIDFLDSIVYWKLRSAIDYLMPIPALLFFGAVRLLGQKIKLVLYGICAVGTALTVAVFIFGPSTRYDFVSRVAATLAVLTLVITLVARRSSEANPDLIVFRRGIITLGAFALFDNMGGAFNWDFAKIEPIGFVAFLSAMGYVAARQTLNRDYQLKEIQQELDLAKRIQLSILPSEFPKSRHFRVAARYLPMTSVAGDFYDYVIVNQVETGLLIADVSGHGVPAALIASMVKLAAASQRGTASDPGKFLHGMNAALCNNTQEQFVTAGYVYLNAEARELRYAAAGHPPMLLARAGAVMEIEQNGLMLALFEAAAYEDTRRPLISGDRLMLYTDGLMEAVNGQQEFFGRPRLSSWLIKTASLPASVAADTIIAAVREWSVTQDDDLTIILCDFVDTALDIESSAAPQS